MYFRELWASCRRRWYIALALLVISSGVCVMAAQAVGPEYEAEASVVLVPPRNPEAPNSNRYLDLGSLPYSVDVLARSMTSAETVEAIQQQAPNAEYEVASDPTTSAPIVLVKATSPDKKAASTMLNAVLDRIPQNLEELQERLGIRSRHQITLVLVAENPDPEPNQKSRIRLLGVIGVGLLFGSTVLVGALDGLLLRRSRRKAAEEGTAPTAADGAPDWTPDRAGDSTKDAADDTADAAEDETDEAAVSELADDNAAGREYEPAD